MIRRTIPFRPRRLLPLVLAGLAAAACGEARSAGEEAPGDGSGVAVPAEPLPVHPGPESDAAEVNADGGEALEEQAESGSEGEAPEAAETPASAPETVVIPEDPPEFERPEHVRGLYLNAWTAGSRRRVAALLEVARRTEVNTFVIDIKDASGYVSHPTAVPLAREAGATGELRIRDLEGLLRRLASEGVYPIARIVVVKDPVLVAARPDLAVQDTAGGVWVDGKDIRWLNPYHREVWDYHVDLAREVARLGFPEIQWDYVRFPDAPAGELARARFPGSDGMDKPEAIRAFLAYSREALSEQDVVVTADVFGVTTSAVDVGIGQVWERFVDVVDVALPMVYPSHYWKGSFGIGEPNAYPYEVVRRALQDGLARSAKVEGAGAIRPWLQAFSLGQPAYGAPEIRAQMQAAYDVGIQEWILWNPSSRYLEGALAPAGGFTSEPTIRVAGRVVPVSRRHEVLREASAAELDSTRVVPPREVAPDTTAGTPSPDSAAVDTIGGTPSPDSAAVDTIGGRTGGRAADTVRPPTGMAVDTRPGRRRSGR